MLEFLSYAVIGVIAGFFSGMLGIGGGVIMVPPMVLIFMHFGGVSAEYATHIAVATSVSIITLTSLSSAFAHSRQKNVLWPMVRIFAVAAATGSVLATLLAPYLRHEFLQLLLTFFLLQNSYNLLLAKSKDGGAGTAPLAIKKAVPVAAFVACMASLTGIGGGILNVPLMKRMGVTLKNAIGCSSVINIVIASTATVGYMLTPSPDIPLSDSMVGMIYPVATASIAALSMLLSLLGARVAVRMPTRALAKVFGTLTFLFALQLIYSLLSGNG